MKIVVTGAGGQVGSELVQQGENLSFTVVAADRTVLDISQRDAVKRFIQKQQPDIVINAAAYTAVDKAETEPELVFAINRDGVTYLAESCAIANIPLFHISTDYVFDGAQKKAYVEDDTPNPCGIYGQSKLAGELALVRENTQHIILRVAWVFAAKGNNFVRTMLRLGSGRDSLSVVADQHGAPTWAGDIAKTLLLLAEQYRDTKSLPWGIYHYAGIPSTTWFGFAETIFAQSQSLNMLSSPPALQAISTDQCPTPAKRPQNSLLNCQKINAMFDIEQADWRIGLTKVLKEWKTK